mgnify:CR=1 FL=1
MVVYSNTTGHFQESAGNGATFTKLSKFSKRLVDKNVQ